MLLLYLDRYRDWYPWHKPRPKSFLWFLETNKKENHDHLRHHWESFFEHSVLKTWQPTDAKSARVVGLWVSIRFNRAIKNVRRPVIDRIIFPNGLVFESFWTEKTIWGSVLLFLLRYTVRFHVQKPQQSYFFHWYNLASTLATTVKKNVLPISKVSHKKDVILLSKQLNPEGKDNQLK